MRLFSKLTGMVLTLVLLPFMFSGMKKTPLRLNWAMVAVIAVLAVGGYQGYHWYGAKGWTAITGTLHVEGQPLTEVQILLTGIETGEHGLCVTDSSGGFTIRTRTGTLSPGSYRITLSEPGDHGSFKVNLLIPEYARNLATSDIDLAIFADQTHYPIEIEKKPGFRLASEASTGASRPRAESNRRSSAILAR